MAPRRVTSVEEHKEAAILGKRIRVARNRRGLTQEKLAELAKVSARHIRDAESGKSPSISLMLATRIIRALGVSIDAMVLGLYENTDYLE